MYIPRSVCYIRNALYSSIYSSKWGFPMTTGIATAVIQMFINFYTKWRLYQPSISNSKNDERYKMLFWLQIKIFKQIVFMVSFCDNVMRLPLISVAYRFISDGIWFQNIYVLNRNRNMIKKNTIKSIAFIGKINV